MWAKQICPPKKSEKCKFCKRHSFYFLPHSAQFWILNPNWALRRARVGFKIRFDQPTRPPGSCIFSFNALWCLHPNFSRTFCDVPTLVWTSDQISLIWMCGVPPLLLKRFRILCGVPTLVWTSSDLQKVLNPSGSAKLVLRSFYQCVTPKSSDQHFHFHSSILSYSWNVILVLIDSFLESSYFQTLCRSKFFCISISGLWIEKYIL